MAGRGVRAGGLGDEAQPLTGTIRSPWAGHTPGHQAQSVTRFLGDKGPSEGECPRHQRSPLWLCRPGALERAGGGPGHVLPRPGSCGPETTPSALRASVFPSVQWDPLRSRCQRPLARSPWAQVPVHRSLGGGFGPALGPATGPGPRGPRKQSRDQTGSGPLNKHRRGGPALDRGDLDEGWLPRSL